MDPINFPPLRSTSASSLSVDGDDLIDGKQAGKNIGADLSARPINKMTKALTNYKSITAEECSVKVVAVKDDNFRQSSVKNAKSQEMASASRISETGSPDSAKKESIGFDLESEEVVKNLAAEIDAEQSTNVLLPDGWQMKEINNLGDIFIGMIVDDKEMPRISYVKKKNFYDCSLNVSILDYDYALRWKSDRTTAELKVRFEKAAYDELKSLMGEKIYDDFYWSVCVVSNPDMFVNHESKLAKHVKPVLEWGDERNNRKVVEKFLNGVFKSSEAAIQLYRFIEMFAVNKDLLKLAELCSENASHCLPADAVYDAWKSSKPTPRQFSKTAGSTIRKMT